MISYLLYLGLQIRDGAPIIVNSPVKNETGLLSSMMDCLGIINSVNEWTISFGMNPFSSGVEPKRKRKKRGGGKKKKEHYN